MNYFVLTIVLILGVSLIPGFRSLLIQFCIFPSIKKLMIDERVPRHLRHRIPVLEGNGVAAAGGFGPHREALALPGEPCLHITMKKGE